MAHSRQRSMLVEGGNFDLLSKPHIVRELHPDVIGCGFVENLPDMMIIYLSLLRCRDRRFSTESLSQ